MSFFSKVFGAVKKIAPVAIGYMVGGPAGAAIGGGLGSAARGGNLSQIIQGAGYGYGAGGLINAGAAGLSAAGTAGAGTAGPAGITWDSPLMAGLKAGGNSLISGVASPLGTLNKLSGVANMAGMMGGSGTGGRPAMKPVEPPKFKPVQPVAMSAPASLAGLSAYSPEQTRSALATKGVNQGLASDENSYYQNLVQRSLIGDQNKITGSMNSLLPIENQYFSRQGYDMSSAQNFLRAMQQH